MTWCFDPLIVSARPIMQPLPILWVWKTYPNGKHSLFRLIDVVHKNEGVFIDTHPGWAGKPPVPFSEGEKRG